MSQPKRTDTDPLDTPSEEELARRVQCGCILSYEELDQRLRPRLIHLLYKRTGSHEDAEDLAQQALMRAYQRIDQYDPKRVFRSWLFTIAVRLAIDAHRRRGVRATGEKIDGVVDPGPGPAEKVNQHDEQQRLWILADRVLNANQRTALWLHYGEQQSAVEIARALGITTLHVRVLLYRARRTLMAHRDESAQASTHQANLEAVQKTVPGYNKSNFSERAVT